MAKRKDDKQEQIFASLKLEFQNLDNYKFFMRLELYKRKTKFKLSQSYSHIFVPIRFHMKNDNTIFLFKSTN